MFWGHSRLADSPCTPGTESPAWESWIQRIQIPNCAGRPGGGGDDDFDLGDLAAFQTHFAAGDLAADLYPDGVLDTFDFLEALRQVRDAGSDDHDNGDNEP